MASGSHKTSVMSLPSNSSMDVYPNNTVADYRIQLPRTLTFNTPHEVALTAFHYPVSWFNFPAGEEYSVTYRYFAMERDGHRMNWGEDQGGGEMSESLMIVDGLPEVYTRDTLLVTDEEGRITNMDEHLPCEFKRKVNHVVLEPGLYQDVEDVLKAMQRGNEEHMDFHYSRVTQKVTLKWTAGGYRTLVSLSPALSAKLGFGYRRSSWRRKKGGTVTGLHVVTMDFIDTLYVNCDLAADSHVVGDAMVPLLKAVSVTGRHGDTVAYEPRVLDWLPLSRNRFDTIRVLITDGTGKPVPFERGHSMVRVHLRERLPF